MRVDCGFKGHERNASIFIGFPLQMARKQFEGNLTRVRIPPSPLETLDFSGVRGFLVTNMFIVQCSAAYNVHRFEPPLLTFQRL